MSSQTSKKTIAVAVIIVVLVLLLIWRRAGKTGEPGSTATMTAEITLKRWSG